MKSTCIHTSQSKTFLWLNNRHVFAVTLFTAVFYLISSYPVELAISLVQPIFVRRLLSRFYAVLSDLSYMCLVICFHFRARLPFFLSLFSPLLVLLIMFIFLCSLFVFVFILLCILMLHFFFLSLARVYSLCFGKHCAVSVYMEH